MNMPPDVPELLIIGRQQNQWMVHAFTERVHALTWVQEEPKLRRLYLCKVEPIEELDFVPPGEATLIGRPIPKKPVTRRPAPQILQGGTS